MQLQPNRAYLMGLSSKSLRESLADCRDIIALWESECQQAWAVLQRLNYMSIKYRGNPLTLTPEQQELSEAYVAYVMSRDLAPVIEGILRERGTDGQSEPIIRPIGGRIDAPAE